MGPKGSPRKSISSPAKLRLVNGYHLSVGLDQVQDLVGVFHGDRSQVHPIVRRDVLYAIAVVQAGFKDLHFLTRDFRAPHPPDQLFSLATEHTAAD